MRSFILTFVSSCLLMALACDKQPRTDARVTETPESLAEPLEASPEPAVEPSTNSADVGFDDPSSASGKAPEIESYNKDAGSADDDEADPEESADKPDDAEEETDYGDYESEG